VRYLDQLQLQRPMSGVWALLFEEFTADTFVPTLHKLMLQLQRRFKLEEPNLLLVLDGFTMPPDAPLECALRDGDILFVTSEQVGALFDSLRP